MPPREEKALLYDGRLPNTLTVVGEVNDVEAVANDRMLDFGAIVVDVVVVVLVDGVGSLAFDFCNMNCEM